MKSQELDLGNGHRFIYVSDQSGKRYGGIHEHPRPDGSQCDGGSIVFQGFGEEPQWNVVQEDPLTLSPSLLCRQCGSHGFIQEGKWVPA